jgi:short-subunit dehydrogenase
MARIVITGASSGIGEAGALALAHAGHDVVATVRTNEARTALLERASSSSIELEVVLLEVTDAAAVESTLDEIAQTAPIDVLINNAGVGVVGTLEELSMEELRHALEVNFFAVAHATKVVLPAMRLAGQGQIITVTSVGGIVGQPFNEAYCAAKFAVEGLMESLAPMAATKGISVSVVEPGPVATSFIANVAGIEGMMETDADAPYASQKAGYLSRAGNQFANAQSADEVAALLVEIVAADQPAFRYQTSAWSTEFVATKLADLDGSAVTSMTSTWIA